MKSTIVAKIQGLMVLLLNTYAEGMQTGGTYETEKV